jgi:hypothetical protein
VLAHQYIGQLVFGDGNTKVRDAVFGNVGTIVAYRIGATDAEFLENEFAPEFEMNDLVNLPKHNVYIKLMIDGVASHPFSAETMPPTKMPLIIYRDVIIRNSQQRYGTPRALVEERIAGEWDNSTDRVVERVARRDEKPLAQVLQAKGATVGAPVSPQKKSNPSQQPKPVRKAVDISDLRRAISDSLAKNRAVAAEEEEKTRAGSAELRSLEEKAEEVRAPGMMDEDTAENGDTHGPSSLQEDSRVMHAKEATQLKNKTPERVVVVRKRQEDSDVYVNTREKEGDVREEHQIPAEGESTEKRLPPPSSAGYLHEPDWVALPPRRDNDEKETDNSV